MDLFGNSMAQLRIHEGGYANVSGDRGGETFRGITAVSFPKWPGWPKVREAVALGNLPGLTLAKSVDKRLADDKELASQEADLYRREFWDKLDRWLTGRVLAKVFNASVNVGLGGGAVILQRALNSLPALKSRLAVDGAIGKMTSAAAERSPGPALLTEYVAAQEAYYRNIVKGKPSQAKFLPAWLTRAKWLPPLSWA
jgi:lysozyme family protein